MRQWGSFCGLISVQFACGRSRQVPTRKINRLAGSSCQPPPRRPQQGRQLRPWGQSLTHCLKRRNQLLFQALVNIKTPESPTASCRSLVQVRSVALLSKAPARPSPVRSRRRSPDARGKQARVIRLAHLTTPAETAPSQCLTQANRPRAANSNCSALNIRKAMGPVRRNRGRWNDLLSSRWTQVHQKRSRTKIGSGMRRITSMIHRHHQGV